MIENKEVIILAGGLGTRLRNTIGEIPKCLAEVAKKPFLHYQIEYLLKQGVTSFIFSLGYKSEMVINYVQSTFPKLNCQFSVESEPLGTGGAIKKALKLTKSKFVLVTNGDTYFDINLDSLFRKANENNYPFTIALFKVNQNIRYGYVSITDENLITQFNEKKEAVNVLVNSGFYLIDNSQISFLDFQDKFSLEIDFFNLAIINKLIYSVEYDANFIDIGIPQDYEIAQTFFKKIKK